MMGISFEKTVFINAVVVFVLCLSVVLEAEPLGTEFTYQGWLIDANSPADGEYDFIFRIYDAESDGTQAGEDVNMPDVDVIDGYFTVELDFGNVFTGQSLWLEIEVRAGDSNDVFNVLSPRQKITALPYALYAASGISSSGSNGIVSRKLDYTIGGGSDTTYEKNEGFSFDISSLDVADPHVNVVASGIRESMGIPECSLIFKWTVSGGTLYIRVWDTSGSEYPYNHDNSGDPVPPPGAAWNGKQFTLCFTATAESYAKALQLIEIVTGSITYDTHPSYIIDVGFVIDVSSEIPAGFTAVDVIAKGRKRETMTGEILGPPLNIYPKVNGTNIEIRVWDEAGNEYGGDGWAGKDIEIIEYALFMKKSGGSVNKRVVAGKFTGLPPNLDNITMSSPLPGANASNTFVVASGFKIEGGETTPLAVRGTVQSPDLISFEVWDIDGNVYSPAAWEKIEIFYCVVDR